MQHLWEVEHDYYCEDCNYRAKYSDATFEYNDWDEFFDDMGDAVLKWNLLFRWDWRTPEKESDNEIRENMNGKDTLYLYYMMQRKGDFRVFIVHDIKRDREDEVKEFLRERFDYLVKLWQPLE